MRPDNLTVSIDCCVRLKTFSTYIGTTTTFAFHKASHFKWAT
jgi:hypothetical protein